MKTLPSEFNSVINGRYAQKFFYAVEIFWTENDSTVYSNNENDLLINGINRTTYAYITNISGLESISRIDGFGNAQSVTVQFIDTFGHFKEKFDNRNIYKSKVNIYIACNTTTLKVFEGSITTDIKYNIDTLVFEITIDNFNKDKPFGYTPNITDILETDPNYDYWERMLDGSTWPEIFGSVKKVNLIPLTKKLEFTVKEDLTYHGDVEYFLKLDGETDLLEENKDYTIILYGNDTEAFFLYITGHFETRGGQFGFVFDKDNIERDIYTELDIETIQPEDPKDQRYRFRVIDETVPHAWLQGLYVRLYNTEANPADVHAITATITQVTKQRGNECETSHKRPAQFSYVEDFPVAWIPNFNKLSWARSQRVGPHKITEGTILVIKEWPVDMVNKPKQNVYIVDSKTDTTIDRVIVPKDNDFEELPIGLYTVLTTSGNDSNRFWSDHQPCMYIEFEIGAFIRFFNKNSSNDTILADLTNDLNTDVKVVDYLLKRYLRTDINVLYSGMQEKMCAAILQEEDLSTIITEILWQKGKVIRDTYDVDGIYTVQIIDLYNVAEDDYESVFTFNGNNIHAKEIILSFIPIDEIITAMRVTVQSEDYQKQPRIYMRKKNVDKFDIRVKDVDYYAYNSYKDTFDFIKMWLDRLSESFVIFEFTTYLDALALETWDYVTIDLGDISFYDRDKGTPLENSHTKYLTSTVVGNIRGRIIDTSFDIENGLITIKIQLTKKMES